jgi:hypothetical protein
VKQLAAKSVISNATEVLRISFSPTATKWKLGMGICLFVIAVVTLLIAVLALIVYWRKKNTIQPKSNAARRAINVFRGVYPSIPPFLNVFFYLQTLKSQPHLH